MVDLAEVQTAYYMVAATGVIVAAIYYVYNMRISQRNSALALKAQEQNLETRQTQLFMQVMDQMDQQWQADFWDLLNNWQWEDFDDYMKKYGTLENPKFINVFSTLEHIGILVNDGQLNPRRLYLWIGGFLISLWSKYEPVILGWRERYEKPPKGMFSEFVESLVLAMSNERRVDDFSARLESRRLAWESLRAASSPQ